MRAVIDKYKLSNAIPPKQEEEYNFAIHKSEQEKPVNARSTDHGEPRLVGRRDSTSKGSSLP